MGNLKQRLERLEGGRRVRERPVILIVRPGESTEEVWQKHLTQHPEDEKAGPRINLHLSGQDQDPPSASPTTKAETEG